MVDDSVATFVAETADVDICAMTTIGGVQATIGRRPSRSTTDRRNETIRIMRTTSSSSNSTIIIITTTGRWNRNGDTVPTGQIHRGSGSANIIGRRLWPPKNRR